MTFDNSQAFVMRFVIGLVGALAVSVVYGIVEVVRWMMRYLVVWLCLVATACGQQPTDEQLRESARTAIIPPDYDPVSDLVRQREFLTKKPIPPGGKRARVSELAELSQKIIEAKGKRWRWSTRLGPELPADKLRPGHIGKIIHYIRTPGGVVQSEILDVEWVDVLQVLGPQEFLGTCGDTVVKFSGFPTDKYANGYRIENIGLIYVVKNTTYETALGTNTVMEVVPLNAENKEKYASYAIPSRMRTWTAGRFTVEAELIDFDGKNVTLRKADGAKPTLPLSKLSKADKDYVQEQLGDP